MNKQWVLTMAASCVVGSVALGQARTRTNQANQPNPQQDGPLWLQQDTPAEQAQGGTPNAQNAQGGTPSVQPRASGGRAIIDKPTSERPVRPDEVVPWNDATPAGGQVTPSQTTGNGVGVGVGVGVGQQQPTAGAAAGPATQPTQAPVFGAPGTGVMTAPALPGITSPPGQGGSSNSTTRGSNTDAGGAIVPPPMSGPQPLQNPNKRIGGPGMEVTPAPSRGNTAPPAATPGGGGTRSGAAGGQR